MNDYISFVVNDEKTLSFKIDHIFSLFHYLCISEVLFIESYYFGLIIMQKNNLPNITQ